MVDMSVSWQLHSDNWKSVWVSISVNDAGQKGIYLCDTAVFLLLSANTKFVLILFTLIFLHWFLLTSYAERDTGVTRHDH